jgi:hypothetical protein
LGSRGIQAKVWILFPLPVPLPEGEGTVYLPGLPVFKFSEKIASPSLRGRVGERGRFIYTACLFLSSVKRLPPPSLCGRVGGRGRFIYTACLIFKFSEKIVSLSLWERVGEREDNQGMHLLSSLSRGSR